jgi:hypothetical protein
MEKPTHWKLLLEQYDISYDLPSININHASPYKFYSQPRDSKLKDTVTSITSATDNQIVKAFGGPDLQLLKFSPGEKFQVAQYPIHDLQSLGLK